MKSLACLFVLIVITHTAEAVDFWQKLDNFTEGPAACQRIIFDKVSGDLFAIMYNSGIYKSIDGGDSWYKVNTEVSSFSDITVDNEGNIFASASGHGVYKSTDDGVTFKRVNDGLGSVKIIALATGDNGNIYAGSWFDPGVYASSNKGETWSDLNFKNGDIYALLAKDNMLFAATEYNGVYVTTDEGKKWSLCGLSGNDVYSLLYCNGRIIAGSSQGVYVSSDSGKSWQQKNSGLKFPYVYSLVSNKSDFIFAATPGGGVFRSTDYGESWTELNSGLSDSVIKTLTIDNYDYIYAGTSKSIYRSRVLSSPVAEEVLNKNILAISVYPNPFSNSATIRINLQNPAKVKLKILNSIGQEVKTIVNQFLDIGAHNYEFHAEDLPTGQYFLIVENGMTVSSETLILAR